VAGVCTSWLIVASWTCWCSPQAAHDRHIQRQLDLSVGENVPVFADINAFDDAMMVGAISGAKHIHVIGWTCEMLLSRVMALLALCSLLPGVLQEVRRGLRSLLLQVFIARNRVLAVLDRALRAPSQRGADLPCWYHQQGWPSCCL